MSESIVSLLDLMIDRLEKTPALASDRPVMFCSRTVYNILFRKTPLFDWLSRQFTPPYPRKYRGPRLRVRTHRPSTVKVSYLRALAERDAETPRYYPVKMP